MSVQTEAQATTPHGPPLWRQLQWTAKLVQGVMAGQSLATQLNQVPGELRSGVQALTFEVLRGLGLATAVRSQLVPRRPPAPADALLCSVLALMLAPGAERYALHTLADQAVEAAKRGRDTRNQAGLINACIRRLSKEREGLLQRVANDPVARWNYPAWWVKQLRSDHPKDWQTILGQSQYPAPMVLRVNVRRSTLDAVMADLAAHDIAAAPVGEAAIQLARPMPVAAIPGFAEGRVSVQSAAAQRAAPLLMADLGTQAPRILDACAAPGGKTAHMLELHPNAQVTALEFDAVRAVRIGETLTRLGLHADVRVADAAKPADWWDGLAFDRIMLDAPCSASGIVRRHPDIRWLRRQTDIAALAALQAGLLEALWPLLAPGGRMLYVTCSVFREEGEGRVQAFVAQHLEAQALPSPGHLLPRGDSGGIPATGENARCDDGFYYALLAKRPG